MRALTPVLVVAAVVVLVLGQMWTPVSADSVAESIPVVVLDVAPEQQEFHGSGGEPSNFVYLGFFPVQQCEVAPEQLLGGVRVLGCHADATWHPYVRLSGAIYFRFGPCNRPRDALVSLTLAPSTVFCGRFPLWGVSVTGLAP
jgi:hypothetical protein